VASFFDDPVLRARLGAITRIEVSASGPVAPDGATTVAGAYLTGWLASRLGWRPGPQPGTWQRADGGTVEVVLRNAATPASGDIAAVRIDIAEGPRRIALAVERAGNGDNGFAHLTVSGVEPACAPRTLKLPSRDQAALLCGILQHTSQDTVYLAALAAT
jgi:glucose-6-phosphate dehydrogenase assembly protein OpcA